MNLGLSLARGGPDLALLFLTMKLVTTTPPPELVSAADLPLYRISKQFMALLEAAGTASLLYLQAMILIALYEHGHAIFPAAWMSVGNCVRYAAMLGLPSYSEAAVVLGNCVSIHSLLIFSLLLLFSSPISNQPRPPPPPPVPNLPCLPPPSRL